MIDAHYARTLTEAVRAEKYKEALISIEYEIRKATEKGQSTIGYFMIDYPEVVKELLALGYFVKADESKRRYFISW